MEYSNTVCNLMMNECSRRVDCKSVSFEEGPGLEFQPGGKLLWGLYDFPQLLLENIGMDFDA